MKLLINYANSLYSSSQKLNSKTGLQVGLFDKVISYSPKDIDKKFYKKNEHILKQRRGGGYYLWKPYFIKKSLEKLEDGDFLFYCDSGAYFHSPIYPIINISLKTGQDIIPFELTLIEKIWTKRDAFVLMDCDNTKYTDSNQRLAGFILFRKSKFTLNFVDEYLFYAQDERIITDNENTCGLPNYPEFKNHRHDQSIFSLLTKKYDLEAYRDPSQWGNDCRKIYPNSDGYDQLIESNRKKDIPLKRKLKRILRSVKRKFIEKKN